MRFARNNASGGMEEAAHTDPSLTSLWRERYVRFICANRGVMKVLMPLSPMVTFDPRIRKRRR